MSITTVRSFILASLRHLTPLENILVLLLILSGWLRYGIVLNYLYLLATSLTLALSIRISFRSLWWSYYLSVVAIILQVYVKISFLRELYFDYYALGFFSSDEYLTLSGYYFVSLLLNVVYLVDQRERETTRVNVFNALK